MTVAVPGYAFVSRSVHSVLMPANQETVVERSVTASCPSSEGASFGGFGSALASIRGMHRTADNHWTVDGLREPFEYGYWRPGKITAIAHCRSGAVPFRVARAKRIRHDGSVTATCPVGTVLLAGGFTASRGTIMAINGLERVVPRQWRVSITAVRGSTKLTSIAYCGRGTSPTLVRRHVALDHAVRTTRATCPAGESLIFGGVIATTPTSALGSHAYVTRMKAGASMHRWTVSAGTFGTEGDLTALAYCR